MVESNNSIKNINNTRVKLITSESVTEGHPDKLCDQISDGILDKILHNDPNARVACEVLATTGLIMVTGEISTNSYIDIPKTVRSIINDIGYNTDKYGFNGSTCAIMTSIDKQSPDISRAVDKLSDPDRVEGLMDYDRIGAGDQSCVFGYATNETKEYMPLSITLAHKLAYKLSEVRKNKTLNYIGPDGKTQVTVEYMNDKPIRVDTIIIATQHNSRVSQNKLREDIIKYVITPVVPPELLDKDTKIHINTSGKFIMGGPKADVGLTGRKIIVDTYGGVGRHGGGAFSGKDPTKVDRSGAYMARHIAKNIVAADLADRCEVQISYAIGRVNPVSVYIDTLGTAKVNEMDLEKAVIRIFDMRPAAIIDYFRLTKIKYQPLAAYGHFGRDCNMAPWEYTCRVDDLKEFLGFKMHHIERSFDVKEDTKNINDTNNEDTEDIEDIKHA